MERRRTALRVRVHAVPGQSRLRRVVVPDPPLRDTHQSLLLWQHTGALTASRADLWRLGALFRLAAVSPHTAVHVPLRRNPRDEHAEFWSREQGLGDLLIMRGDVGLRPAHWTALRTRLGRGPRPGRLAFMSVPPPRPPVAEPGWDWREHALGVHEHGDTVFWSGTARALYAAGDDLTWCSGQVSRHVDIRRHGGPALLSQWTGPGRPDRSAGRRDTSWECMILAVDPRRRRP
ncbi:hypothetical protein [Catellatospora sichuanensis]|uniref:hypothetical protein n=1 Tax=Catellatospora sichuanensis TaxID=1969805 RepID=UPI001182F3CE|nr:hypothetical protein [Catellatospora sichuanensis]